MDATTLSTLTRSELQVLAKANGIKANLKSAKIITELLKVLPIAIPLPSASRAPSPIRQPHAPSPSLGPEPQAHPMPTPNRLPTFSVVNNPVAGQSIPFIPESISQVLGGGYQGSENVDVPSCSASPLVTPDQHVGGQSSRIAGSTAEKVSAHRITRSVGVQAGAQVHNAVGEGNPVVAEAHPELASPLSINGGSSHPHDADRNPVPSYEAENAVRVLSNISWDHMMEYQRIRIALHDVAAIKERTRKNKQILMQERAMRIRMENYASYWRDVGPTWTTKEVYNGSTTAARFADGKVEEKFSELDTTGSDSSSPEKPVEVLDMPVRDLYDLQVSPTVSELETKKRAREESSPVGDEEHEVDDDVEGGESPLARKRRRIAVGGGAQRFASFPLPGSDDDAQNVASLLTADESAAADSEYEDLATALPTRPSELEPIAGPSQPLRRSFRLSSLPPSSPPRYSAIQKGKGRARD